MGRIMKINEHDMLKEMTLDEIRLFAYKIYKKKGANNSIEEEAKVVKILSCYTDFPNPYYDLAHIVDNIKNYQSKKKNKNKK